MATEYYFLYKKEDSEHVKHVNGKCRGTDYYGMILPNKMHADIAPSNMDS